MPLAMSVTVSRSANKTHRERKKDHCFSALNSPNKKSTLLCPTLCSGGDLTHLPKSNNHHYYNLHLNPCLFLSQNLYIKPVPKERIERM